jgi:hypothetical protein
MSETLGCFGPQGDHFSRIRARINVYEGAIRGIYDVHYWLDGAGALFTVRATLPGERMESTLEEFTPESMAEAGIVHAGIMSREALQQRIDLLKDGNSEHAIAEAG